MFSGCKVDRYEDPLQQMCEDVEAMKIVAQGGRCKETRGMGNGVGTEMEHTTRPLRIGWVQEHPQLLSVSGSFVCDEQMFRCSECGSDVLMNSNVFVAESVCDVCMRPVLAIN
jgi:hypothetical protein